MATHSSTLAWKIPWTENQWSNLRRAETKRKKKFSLKLWKKETPNTISLKKKKNSKRQRNMEQMKEQIRNTEV